MDRAINRVERAEAVSAALRGEPVALAHALGRAGVLSWHELPRLIAASALVVLSWIPLGFALATGWVMVVPATLALGAAGVSALMSVAAEVAAGERTRMRALLRIDVVWVALATICGSILASAIVGQSTTGIAAASAVGAAALLLLPLAGAYGAVRDRRGLAALRGGFVIAVLRPSVAVSVAAVGVLAVFAVIATAGVLVLVVPAGHAVYTCLLASQVVESARADT